MKPRVVEGGRKELGRQLIRAMAEFRSDDVRTIANRIAHRARLSVVDAIDARAKVAAEQVSNTDTPDG